MKLRSIDFEGYNVVGQRRRCIRRLAPLVIALGIAVGVSTPGLAIQTVFQGSGVEFMSVDEVEPGMRAVGKTVIRGTQPEKFEAEILGVLRDVYPKQDLIIARLEGLGLEESGVVSGMSGSPIFVEDKMIGAVAYRLMEFGKEAIAGIIPIESMLRVQLRQQRDELHGRGDDLSRAVLVAAAAYAAGEETAQLPTQVRPAGAVANLFPIATPVTMAGLQPGLVDRLQPLFEAFGWRSIVGGVAGRGRRIEPRLEPGGAVAVQLVRGDINLTASGTVTYRDGDHVLAFGHPFMQGGSVDFPMVGAEVITVLKSFASSSKLAVAGHEILGSIRQDRLPAILGVVGAEPSMIPVRLDVDDGGSGGREFRFEMVSDKMLTPLFLFLGLLNGVQSVDKVFGDSTLEVGAEFFLGQGLETVRFENLFSSRNQATISVAGTIASIFDFLYDNAFGPIEVREIGLSVKARSDRKIAQITGVSYDRSVVDPGETVNLAVALKPYREPQVIERVTLTIPPEVSTGTLNVLIGDARSVSTEEASFIQGQFKPASLRHLVRLLNNIRRNDRIYVQVSRADEGASVRGEVMPSLPPSVLEVLSSRQTSGDVIRLKKSVIVEEEKQVDFVVSGVHRMEIKVRRR